MKAFLYRPQNWLKAMWATNQYPRPKTQKGTPPDAAHAALDELESFEAQHINYLDIHPISKSRRTTQSQDFIDALKNCIEIAKNESNYKDLNPIVARLIKLGAQNCAIGKPLPLISNHMKNFNWVLCHAAKELKPMTSGTDVPDKTQRLVEMLQSMAPTMPQTQKDFIVVPKTSPKACVLNPS